MMIVLDMCIRKTKLAAWWVPHQVTFLHWLELRPRMQSLAVGRQWSCTNPANSSSQSSKPHLVGRFPFIIIMRCGTISCHWREESSRSQPSWAASRNIQWRCTVLWQCHPGLSIECAIGRRRPRLYSSSSKHLGRSMTLSHLDVSVSKIGVWCFLLQSFPPGGTNYGPSITGRDDAGCGGAMRLTRSWR
jgi:hypothetical protein